MMSKRDNQLTIPMDQSMRQKIDQEAENRDLGSASYARMILKQNLE